MHRPGTARPSEPAFTAHSPIAGHRLLFARPSVPARLAAERGLGRVLPGHPVSFSNFSSSKNSFSILFSNGHIRLALSLISSGHQRPLNQEQLFELTHHLLKANPHKYLAPELAARLSMPQGRDAQLQWLKLAAAGGGGLANALLCRRNIFYPNSKAIFSGKML
jgi:hypothetical protein